VVLLVGVEVSDLAVLFFILFFSWDDEEVTRSFFAMCGDG
jgi:hypothetical protein